MDGPAEEKLPVERAVGTMRLANEFTEVAESCSPDREINFARYFLCGHALELAFKAVLIVEGTSEKRLRTIGHDLNQAMTRALAFAGGTLATLGRSEQARVRLLSALYEEKGLEYVAPGAVQLPRLSELLRDTAAVVAEIEAWVDQEVRARL